MPELIVKGKKKKYKYTEKGIRSYKEQLAKNKKMPKRQDNDSDESVERYMKDPHYQPKMDRGIIGGYGVKTRELENQDPEKKSVKKTKKRKRLTPSKPQKGY